LSNADLSLLYKKEREEEGRRILFTSALGSPQQDILNPDPTQGCEVLPMQQLGSASALSQSRAAS
jgi:hypothetical protein